MQQKIEQSGKKLKGQIEELQHKERVALEKASRIEKQYRDQKEQIFELSNENDEL